MLALVALLVLVAPPSGPANASAPVPSVTVVPTVTIPHVKYVLEHNGLEVILAHDPRLPLVAVNIWYHVGPANEPAGRTGFAHLFEHLMFQGSKHVADDEHLQRLEAAGASTLNGTTGFDRTNYYATVPANQLELALWLESDRMGFLAEGLTQEKLDQQRAVVMEERRQTLDNAPYGPSGEKLFQTLYPKSHPYYGYVIGSMDDLAAATLADVRDFYDRYYAPGNATLVIAGDFDVERARSLVARYFGTLTRRATAPTRAVPPTEISREQRLTVSEPVQLARIAMAWHSPALYQEGDADADVLAFILGEGLSSRLHRKLVYELRLAQNVDVSQQSNALGSVFTISASARPGVAPAKLEAELQKLVDHARRSAPSADEVTRARNMLMTDVLQGLQDLGEAGGKADTLNRYNHYLGDPDKLAWDLARYTRVTPASVRALAERLLDTQKRVVVLTEPTPEPTPTEVRP